MNRLKPRSKAAWTFEFLFVVFFGILNLVPIFWGLITSLKTPNLINTMPPIVFGFTPTIDHYVRVLSSGFFKCIVNTFMYAIISIIAGVILGYFAAYGFVRREFPLKKLFFFIVVVGIPLSTGSSVLLIPNYMYLLSIKMTNHWYTMPLIYTAYHLPMAIWQLIAGIKGVPSELEEAAYIDGANQGYVLGRLLPPLLLPSVAAAALLIFIGAWNDYITASVMVGGNDLKNIQMAIYDYMGYFGQEWGPLTASATCAIIPILLVFTFLGKQLVSGLTAGAVKG